MRKLLYLEDDIDIANAIKEALKYSQYDLIHSNTTKSFLESFENSLDNKLSPGLVLLDYELPDGNGIKVANIICSRLKERKIERDFKIILFSNQNLDGFSKKLKKSMLNRNIDAMYNKLITFDIIEQILDNNFIKD